MVKTRPTAKSKKFLQDFRLFGKGMGIHQFCVKHRYSPNSPNEWVKRIIGFSEEFSALKKLHASSETSVPGRLSVPARHEPGMPDWQIAFLETWRVSRSRIKACDVCGKPWATVRRAMSDDPLFKRCYRNIQKEILLEIEDSLLQQAMDGKVNAQTKVLETWDPQYAPKIKHDHNHQVYGNLAFSPGSDTKAAEEWKVIEGKVVEEESKSLPPG